MRRLELERRLADRLAQIAPAFWPTDAERSRVAAEVAEHYEFGRHAGIWQVNSGLQMPYPPDPSVGPTVFVVERGECYVYDDESEPRAEAIAAALNAIEAELSQG
ncbi:MAG: hypothetical protein ACM37V_07215 [Gemmatimonadota bacterium]